MFVEGRVKVLACGPRACVVVIDSAMPHFTRGLRLSPVSAFNAFYRTTWTRSFCGGAARTVKLLLNDGQRLATFCCLSICGALLCQCKCSSWQCNDAALRGNASPRLGKVVARLRGFGLGKYVWPRLGIKFHDDHRNFFLDRHRISYFKMDQSGWLVPTFLFSRNYGFFYYCRFVAETRGSIRLRKLHINVYVTLKILRKTIRLCIVIILAMFDKQI